MTRSNNRLMVIHIITMLVWSAVPASAITLEECRDSHPHVILPFASKEKEAIVVGLLVIAHVPQTGHVTTKGDQDIFGSLALGINLPKDLKQFKHKTIIVFEASRPKNCALNVARDLALSPERLIEGENDFFYVSLEPLEENGVVVGFRPPGLK